MQQPTLDLVVCSLEAWDDVWRRNQHLVDQLRRSDAGLRVLFVEPADDVWRRARFGRRRLSPAPPVALGRQLWRFRPLKPLPRVLGPAADRAITRQVRAAAASLGLDDPVLWLNDLSLVPLARASGWPMLYDITDDWLAESTVPARVRRRRATAERWALSHSETVVVCSPGLQASKGRERATILVPNGVDLHAMTTPQQRPDDLGSGPIAAYVGTLHEERLDVDVLVDLAQRIPDVRVVLVGPDALSPTTRARLDEVGVARMGPRPHSVVPAYLQHADVVVVPHLVNRFTESLDPIKAYECLAVGTPTVATPVAGFRGLGGTIITASSATFSDAVASVLATGPERAPGLPPEATWESRSRQFADALLATAERRGVGRRTSP